MKRCLRILICCFLAPGTLTVFPGDWGQEKTIVETFNPRKIVLTPAAIDSLLAQPLTLSDCVAIALKQNIRLQIDRLEYNRVYQSKQGTRQSFLPNLTLSGERGEAGDIDSLDNAGNRSYNDRLSLGLSEKMPLGGSIAFSSALDWSTNGSTRLTDQPANRWEISFSQPLLRGFGYSIAYSDVQLASLDLKIERHRLESAVLQIIFEVKQAYFDVLRQQKLVAATEAAIERDQKLKEISQAKVDAKIATRRDVLSAEIILQQDYAELVNAQTEYETALDLLKDVIGADLVRPIELAAQDLVYQPVTIAEETWIDIARERNTGLRLQELVLQRNEFQARLAGNSRLPDLALQGSYARTTDQDNRDDGSYNWSGRVTLSYPLFNFAARANHQRSRIALRQSERTLEDARRLVMLGVREAARNLRNSQERINILIKNIDAAREKVVFANTMFNLGKADNKDITDAQEDLLAAEVDYAQELSDYYVEQARLEQLLGGYAIINP